MLTSRTSPYGQCIGGNLAMETLNLPCNHLSMIVSLLQLTRQ